MKGRGVDRRAFSVFLASALPSAGAAPHRGGLAATTDREQFLRDLMRSFEQQITGLDMADVRSVLAGLRTPSFRSCVASGSDRAGQATRRGMAGRHSSVGWALVVAAFRPGEIRWSEYKAVCDLTRACLDPQAFIIFGACHDDRLTPGSVRVSALLG